MVNEMSNTLISDHQLKTQDNHMSWLDSDDLVVLIVNLHAGVFSEGSAMAEVIDELTKQELRLEIYQTLTVGHGTVLAAKHGMRADLIICAGGDGTLNEVTNGLMSLQNPPPLAYIPAGTTCDFARTLHIPIDDYRAAARLAISGKPVALDIGTMNANKNFVYVASFGAFTSVASQTSRKMKKQWGHLAYVVEGLKSIANIKPIRVKVEMDDATFEEDLLFGSISNATSIGGLLRINENAVLMDDGKFEVMLIKSHVNPIETGSLISALLNQDYHDKNIIFFSTNRLRLTFEKPQAWTVDGEDAGIQDVVEIKNLRQALRVVIPMAD